MSGLESFLYRLGIWCFEHSGRDVDYIDALVAVERAERKFIEMDNRRAIAESQSRTLLKCVKLVDGLLSSEQPEKAQQQLRVGIIAAGGIATPRKPRSAPSSVSTNGGAENG